MCRSNIEATFPQVTVDTWEINQEFYFEAANTFCALLAGDFYSIQITDTAPCFQCRLLFCVLSVISSLSGLLIYLISQSSGPPDCHVVQIWGQCWWDREATVSQRLAPDEPYFKALTSSGNCCHAISGLPSHDNCDVCKLSVVLHLVRLSADVSYPSQNI